jgi:hypothetical protein
MACFHVKKNQHAVLKDSAGNFLRFQTAELCLKCGKVFEQELKEWDFQEGVFVSINL